MGFHDFTKIERAMRSASCPASRAVFAGARAFGYTNIEFVDPVEINELCDVRLHSRGVFINNTLCLIHFLENVRAKLSCGQAMSRTNLVLNTLRAVNVQLFYVRAVGDKEYKPRMFVIPSKDLIETFFEGEPERLERAVCFPLEHPPENPIFPFSEYEDRWSVIPR